MTAPWQVKEHKDIGYHVRMRPAVVGEPAFVVEYEVRRYTNDLLGLA